MKRYHFSIGGGINHVGIAGAIYAENDDQALTALQTVIDELEEYSIVDNYRGTEPDLANATTGISYVNIYSNSMQASMEMFDEIECSDDLSAISS